MKKKLTAILILLCLTAGHAAPVPAASLPGETAPPSQTGEPLTEYADALPGAASEELIELPAIAIDDINHPSEAGPESAAGLPPASEGPNTPSAAGLEAADELPPVDLTGADDLPGVAAEEARAASSLAGENTGVPAGTVDGGGRDGLTEAVPAGEDIPMTPALTQEKAGNKKIFSSATPLSGKTYQISCAYAPSLLVDVAKKTMSKGSNVHIFENIKSYRQYFTFIKNSDNTWTILNYKSSKVLAASGAVKAKANVCQLEDKGKDTQRWKLKKNADGSFSFRIAKDPALALEVEDGVYVSGGNLRLQSFDNVKSEHFLLKEVSPKNFSGTIMLRPAASPQMALGARLGLSAADTPIVLADAEGVTWQKYKLTHVYGGYYTITNAKTGLALALEGGKFNSGTRVIQTACTGEAAQLWKPWRVSDGVLRFTSRLHSERVLGVKPSEEGDSVAVSRGFSASNTNQQFLTASCVSDRSVGTFAIRSCVDTDRVVEPVNTSDANGKSYLSKDWSGASSQYFKMLPAIARGKRDYYYRLVNEATGKLLVVKGNKAQAGAAIVTGTWTGALGQLWHPVVNGNGTVTLVSALGSTLALELAYGSNSYDTSLRLGNKSSDRRFRWQLTSMVITSAKINTEDPGTVTVTAQGLPADSDDGKLYLFAVNGYSPTINNYKPRASQPAAGLVAFTVPLNLNASTSLIQKRFYLGILKKGKYVMASNGLYITNPEDGALRTTAFPKAASKKGLKMTLSYLDLAVSLNCSHAVFDFPIETYLSGSDFAYKYQGKTYYFSSAIKWQTAALKKFHDEGILVTGIFYLSSKLTDYIQPSAAASSGSGALYALNTKNANRKRLEALFSCLADEWTRDGIYVANWIYGNESDQYRLYNFTGDVSYNQYHESWAEGFRLFNAAIKSRWKNARTYVSLDHNWNLPANGVPAGTYNGQQLLKDFNTDLIRQGGIHWDMCMHPYPSPEQDCRIWIPSFYVENTAASPQITPLNAGAFAAGLKADYGKNVHVILAETGISSVFQGTARPSEQAAAVALAYYLTEFDSNLDMIGIHRERDNAAEMAGGWHLGLYYSGSDFSQPKPSAAVFKYMDTVKWNKYTKACLPCITKDGAPLSAWTDIVPGFNGAALKKRAS